MVPPGIHSTLLSLVGHFDSAANTDVTVYPTCIALKDELLNVRTQTLFCACELLDCKFVKFKFCKN